MTDYSVFHKELEEGKTEGCEHSAVEKVGTWVSYSALKSTEYIH